MAIKSDGGVTWSNISNTGVYSGANSQILTITGAKLSMDDYRYRCVVSGNCSPDATTSSDTLTVDDCTNESLQTTLQVVMDMIEICLILLRQVAF